jgi:hypothetical protein
MSNRDATRRSGPRDDRPRGQAYNSARSGVSRASHFTARAKMRTIKRSMQALKNAIAVVLFGVSVACTFERDIPPEEFASERPTRPCLRNEDCAAPAICFKGLCTPPCEDDQSCAPGTCDLSTGRCVGTLLIGETCYVNADCAAQECVQITINETRTGYCTESCSRDGGCPPPLFCDSFAEVCSK